MAAALGGLDVLAFTGGVGEYLPAVLGFLGVAIDPERNAATTGDGDGTAPGSSAPTVVVTSSEDVEIARQVRSVLAEPASGSPSGSEGTYDDIHDIRGRDGGGRVTRQPDPAATSPKVFRAMVACALRTFRLLAGRRLHMRTDRLRMEVRLPDGRLFEVFRDSSCDAPSTGRPVTLAVWFHLRGVPAGARARRFLFERESILNNVLFAGFEGYLVKLWMVSPTTSDYAGLYSWSSAEGAERYGRYIAAVLGPLSVPGSVGFEILPDVTLDEYLARPQ